MLRRIAFTFLPACLLALVLFQPAPAQHEKKIIYGILIDNTGSLRSQFDKVLMISKGIVEHAHQRGPISLFNFRSQGDVRNAVALITSGTEWSQDKDRLERYIDSLYVEPGQTTLLDAINSAAAQISAKAQLDKDAVGDKILFIITDGEDRASHIRDKQLIKTLQENGIKVYAVGLTEELDRNNGFIRQGAKDKAVDFLKKIAEETGGRAVFPKSKKDGLSSLLSELFMK